MLQQVLDFLTTPGNGDRIAGLVIAFMICATLAGILFYHVLDITLNFFKSLLSIFDFSKFRPKDRIVEVPKYIEPPVNKEIEKYLTILKQIADNYKNSVKL